MLHLSRQVVSHINRFTLNVGERLQVRDAGAGTSGLDRPSHASVSTFHRRRTAGHWSAETGAALGCCVDHASNRVVGGASTSPAMLVVETSGLLVRRLARRVTDLREPGNLRRQVVAIEVHGGRSGPYRYR